MRIHAVVFPALAVATLAVATLPAATLAQPAAAQRIEIDMASFSYMPAAITLHHGQAYTLRFVNRARGGHDFTAKAFFAAAQVAPADRAKVSGGEVELAGGTEVDVHLIAPAPGRYGVHCSHFMHKLLGMKAAIIVD